MMSEQERGFGNKRKLVAGIFLGVLLAIGLFYYWLREDDISANGMRYPSKEKLCQQFALSYLRTIRGVEPEFDAEKWEMAVDIETEFYDLCMLDLTREAISNFMPNSLEKYSVE